MSYEVGPELEAFLKGHIRDIPDFPKKGIIFRDITTLLLSPEGLAAAVEALAAGYEEENIDIVAGVEARGFILGGALALKLGAGFVPVRKPGKLPAATYGEDYDLEYGTDRLEIHQDALKPGERVLLVDDLIATGGTAAAAVSLIQRIGAHVAGCCFVVDLPDLGGRARIEAMGCDTKVLCAFEGH
jgi:adenine phosphoribosyltransferase